MNYWFYSKEKKQKSLCFKRLVSNDPRQVKGYNQHQASVYIASNSKNRSQQCVLLRQKKFSSKLPVYLSVKPLLHSSDLLQPLSKKLVSSLQYKRDSMLLLQYPKRWHHPKTCSNHFCFVPLRVLPTRAHGGTPLAIKDNDVEPLVRPLWIKL